MCMKKLMAVANISYLWNFGSLLGFCLVIQILSGCFLAMQYLFFYLKLYMKLIIKFYISL